jgi:hypothetical protein
MTTLAELEMIWEYEVAGYLKVLFCHPPTCPAERYRRIIQQRGVLGRDTTLIFL